MGQSIPDPIVKSPNGGLRVLDNYQALEAMPLAQYYQDVRGNIVNAQSAFYYDTAYAKVGVAIPANARQSLFTLGKSENGFQYGTATAMGEKGEFLTNMVGNGMFDDNTNFIMEGAGVQCVMSADLPTTVGENGQITAPNYTASVVISAVNNLLAALENLELRFIRGEEIKKRAPLKYWPAPPGVGLEGANGSPNGGFFQNSRGGLAQFTHPVVLQGGDRFQFDLANVGGAAWTPTVGFKVCVVIWGTAIKPHLPY